ncbi:hypothetical protein FQR65_LT13781 [Abscondita terminalis]|nr:hypothetical protein FQR65_LT13781 [Abscondita terminalis]
MTDTKRGANLTQLEKQHLMLIVNRYLSSTSLFHIILSKCLLYFSYSSIIECKRTNFANNKKKEEAWIAIGVEFNAVATSGDRDWRKLRHIYLNIKHRLRKANADENKTRYIKRLTEAGVSEAEASAIIKADAQEKVLAVIRDQVTPLENEFDDANIYFGILRQYFTFKQRSFNISIIIFIAEELDVPLPLSVIPFEDIPSSSTQPPTLPTHPPISRPTLKKTQLRKKQRKENLSSEQFKKLYFKQKLSNAILQRKIMLKEHNMNIKEHNLKIKKYQNNL